MGLPGLIGSQVPDGPDAVWVALKLQAQQAQQALAFAASAQAVASQLDANVATRVAALASGGTTWRGPVNTTGAVAAATVTATGAISGASVAASSGDVTTPASLRGADIFATNAPTFNITGGRVTAWWETATGRGGFTASSRRFKTEIGPADIDPLAVLKIGAKHYRYIDELRKRDDPTFEGYVGPEYRVALEVGMIAEDLHDAGLWQFVIYERDYTLMDTEPSADPAAEPVKIEGLRLDGKGKPIPQSIHYELWSIAVHRAAQYVWAEHLRLVELQKADRVDIDRILAKLSI